MQCLNSFSASGIRFSFSSTTHHYHPHSLLVSSSSSSSSLSASLTLPRRFSFPFFTLSCPSPHYPLISSRINHPHGPGSGSFFPRSHHLLRDDDDFLQATLLLSETVKHHQLRKQGFQEEAKRLYGQLVPFSAQVKDFRAHANSIGLGLLRQFRNPTIFLKISCEGDFLLPIVVGEYAVETLIDSLNEDDQGDYYSNHFQFVRNLVFELGHEVKMVKITERVVNTYFARVYIGKVGERESFSVDTRPSDAMNLAKRCKAPIYVNKQIVQMDAIAIANGTGRVRDTKPIYDVLLDSPMEGPDLLVEELNLLQNMKLAVKEERYNDAAMWKDKLVKLRHSGL